MSRCFPYPPPYYDGPLIESIKLQKEREKATKKEKKREKKEKKRKAKETGNSEHTKHKEKKRKYKEVSQLNQKDGDCRKITTDAVEHLERSGLTEEHELPCSIQNTYESSESSQDICKRRKVVATNLNRNKHGTTILRIKLPVAKQRVPEQQAVSEEPCSSGRAGGAAPEREAAETPHSTSSSEGGRGSAQAEERRFRKLMVNWNPPPLQMECSGPGEDDWLCGTPLKLRTNPIASRCNAITEGLSSHGNDVASSLQPRACYLPEFDTYQLPYVIPF